MEMWCRVHTGRDSWESVGPPTWERAWFNSPEWSGGSSPVETKDTREKKTKMRTRRSSNRWRHERTVFKLCTGMEVVAVAVADVVVVVVVVVSDVDGGHCVCPQEPTD